MSVRESKWPLSAAAVAAIAFCPLASSTVSEWVSGSHCLSAFGVLCCVSVCRCAKWLTSKSHIRERSTKEGRERSCIQEGEKEGVGLFFIERIGGTCLRHCWLSQQHWKRPWLYSLAINCTTAQCTTVWFAVVVVVTYVRHLVQRSPSLSPSSSFHQQIDLFSFILLLFQRLLLLLLLHHHLLHNFCWCINRRQIVKLAELNWTLNTWHDTGSHIHTRLGKHWFSLSWAALNYWMKRLPKRAAEQNRTHRFDLIERLNWRRGQRRQRLSNANLIINSLSFSFGGPEFLLFRAFVHLRSGTPPLHFHILLHTEERRKTTHSKCIEGIKSINGGGEGDWLLVPA